jgi:hypothetical protein
MHLEKDEEKIAEHFLLRSRLGKAGGKGTTARKAFAILRLGEVW